MLGARDGLVLMSGGMALDLTWRQRWRWAGAAAALSLAWLLMLSQWLYPWLRDGERPKAAGRMFSHLSGSPLQILQSLDWSGGSQYLLLLCLPCIWLWRRRSLPTLLIGTGLGVWWLRKAWRGFSDSSGSVWARKFFLASLIYLSGIFAILTVDVWI